MILKTAFVFPGQGAQYAGMGRDFAAMFSEAREVFQQADDLLERSLSTIMFEGPEDKLTQTANSQVAIYVMSMAILRVIQKQFPNLQPNVCAGFSLGEYSAVTAASRLSLEACLPLVEARGRFMNDACEANQGSMAAIIGLSSDVVTDVLSSLDGVWVANFNCPGQVVISGTQEGVVAAIEVMKAQGAKRALPLKVYGAFHSPLMQSAQERMEAKLQDAPLSPSSVGLVMNVTGGLVDTPEEMRRLMAAQVTSSVQWETTMKTLKEAGIERFIEIGPGKVLSGFIRRGIGVKGFNVDRIEDLEALENAVTQG